MTPNLYLKQFLDERFLIYNRPSFVIDDPISVPHSFQKKEDREIAGLIAAIFAWGQRKTAISKANHLLGLMNNRPLDFLLSATEMDYKPMISFVHRTFNGDDCLGLMYGLAHIYKHLGGLEEVFTRGFAKGGASAGIQSVRSAIAVAPLMPRTFKHFPDPEQGSAAKRMNMFLRWMVRNDGMGVDFGLWKKINSCDLICPLDLHVGKAARELTLLKRKQNDWKAALELTDNLKQFDSDDPVKYDFALFGYSMYEIKNIKF
jgi:uncharacterized protein (TIGR02757 family)